MPRTRYLLLLALAAYLLTGLAQVRPEERAVVRRFGKVVARPGPGLWVGLPWGIDTVDRVPVRTLRQVTVGYDPATASDAGETRGTPSGQLLTGDQNLVNVQLVLAYAIGETDADLDDFVMHQDQADAVLARETEAAAAEWAAGRPVDEVLLTGNAALPAWLMDRLADRLRPCRLGVRVQRVSVALLAPPDEVRTAFEMVNQAQNAIRTRENQARQEAGQRLRQAESLRYRLEQEAEEYRDTQLQQARADTAEFLADLAAYQELRKTVSREEALAFVWWKEVAKARELLRARGSRVEPLDAYLGPDGLDLNQVLTPKRR
jgi:membrane protease subunit HflK